LGSAQLPTLRHPRSSSRSRLRPVPLSPPSADPPRPPGGGGAGPRSSQNEIGEFVCSRKDAGCQSGSTSGLRHIQDPAPAREQVFLKLDREADALLDGEHPVRVDVAQHSHILAYANLPALCDDLRGKSHCCRRVRACACKRRMRVCIFLLAARRFLLSACLSLLRTPQTTSRVGGQPGLDAGGDSLPLLAAERKIPRNTR
jgi:hypothetical protein